MYHEWSHLVKFKFNQNSDLFDKAASFEEKSSSEPYYADDYAKKDSDENFAVHLGETMMLPEPDTFMLMAQKAPVRTVALAKALQASMNEVPYTDRSIYGQHFVNRLGYVSEEVLPLAQQTLKEQLVQGTPDAQKLAAEL